MHKQHKYPYGSFVCMIQVPFLLSPFSVAVWITVFARFDCCLNLFQSIAKHWNTGAKLFSILKNMSSGTPTMQIPVRFVCVYASSMLDFVAVSNRFSRLVHCFLSLFESV